ncbi:MULTISPECIES: hypothetical protein [unclassified Psychrobacter]|uniref:hypothetical protein n=1 Tax=unclassified Psychrobacter TaxID=196806 RepID=UPI0018F3E4D2|nr:MULTISPECIES: hypothetical protein [unclassified Psychrobacter]
MTLNYLFNPEDVAKKTEESRATFQKKQPGVDFTEFAAGVIYERLKGDIRHYRVYGPYWWALKDVLQRQDFNVGDEMDGELKAQYAQASDAETIQAADMFFLQMSRKVMKGHNSWTIQNGKDDYVLYDADMEERRSVTDSVYDF